MNLRPPTIAPNPKHKSRNDSAASQLPARQRPATNAEMLDNVTANNSPKTIRGRSFFIAATAAMTTALHVTAKNIVRSENVKVPGGDSFREVAQSSAIEAPLSLQQPP
jgi:hypothetical protein